MKTKTFCRLAGIIDTVVGTSLGAMSYYFAIRPTTMLFESEAHFIQKLF